HVVALRRFYEVPCLVRGVSVCVRAYPCLGKSPTRPPRSPHQSSDVIRQSPRSANPTFPSTRRPTVIEKTQGGRMTRATIVPIALLALTATVARAQETTRVAVSPESKLWIEGTSNLHGWACRTQALDAVVELDLGVAAQLSVAPP